MTPPIKSAVEFAAEKLEGVVPEAFTAGMRSTIEEDFPNITALAKRLQDVCETCGENLAQFDCERCGKRTCNHCKTFSEFLTGAKFCTPECVKAADDDDYLNRKSGC